MDELLDLTDVTPELIMLADFCADLQQLTTILAENADMARTTETKTFLQMHQKLVDVSSLTDYIVDILNNAKPLEN